MNQKQKEQNEIDNVIYEMREEKHKKKQKEQKIIDRLKRKK